MWKQQERSWAAQDSRCQVLKTVCEHHIWKLERFDFARFKRIGCSHLDQDCKAAMGCRSSKDPWVEAATPDGQKYWYNPTTGEGTHVGCLKPREGETGADAAARTGWVERTNRSGGVYWYHLATFDVTPVGCAKPLEGETVAEAAARTRQNKIWGTVATLEGHSSNVYALAVLDAGRLASGSYDSTVRIWSAEGKANDETNESSKSNRNVSQADATETNESSMGNRK